MAFHFASEKTFPAKFINYCLTGNVILLVADSKPFR
jgi:hypothetical protein